MSIYQLVFYVFAAIMLFAGVMVISSRNPVHGVLYLVLAFFASSVLWMMLQVEFLALVLIFVYVGAVMTLFLFVVMMLNIQEVSMREGLVRYFPIALFAMVVMVGFLIYVVGPKHFGFGQMMMTLKPENYSNVRELGNVLYTQYMYPFELAAVLLLVAIVAAISLAFRGRQNSKTQSVAKQVAVSRDDRVELIDMKSEK